MKFWFFAYTLLFVSFFLLFHEWERLPDGRLHVTLLDVGQGDAILITTPGNQRVVIDGGPDLALLERLGEELPFFERDIDLLILSHPDSDHITALPEILKRYTIKKVLMTGTDQLSSRYFAFLDELRDAGTDIIIADAKHDLDLGEDVFLDILWPDEKLFGKKVKKPNNSSIVAKLIWKDHTILLTGDIEEETESALFASGQDITSDVLKVPHHGSKTSSSTGFLVATQPNLAVISVGEDNSYGHPHPQVLARYEEMGIPVRRTDREGRVELVFD